MEYRYRCEVHGDQFAEFPMGEATPTIVCQVCPCLADRVFVMPMISAAAMPVRDQARREAGVSAPPAGSSNSWERGIATDERGMPFLGKGMAPIGVKEFSQRRTEIDEYRRRLKQDPTVLQPEGATP